MTTRPPALSYEQVDEYRCGFHRSLLLFITDRCPVGCGHCSVDSRPTSPRISDMASFLGLVDAIAAHPEIELVGISGGEPFIERRALGAAVSGLREADKLVVPYTSGVWARNSIQPWVKSILQESSAVFLSTDAFHAENIDEATFIRAACGIREEGAGLIVQVMGIEKMVDEARRLVTVAFGEEWPPQVEINITPFLSYGRARTLLPISPTKKTKKGSEFGPCPALASPVARYDGTVTACCNEQVIMAHGPDSLRRRVSGSNPLTAALNEFASDPLLQIIHKVGPGPLTAHPRLSEMATERFTSICDLCWKIAAVRDGSLVTDVLASAISTLEGHKSGCNSNPAEWSS